MPHVMRGDPAKDEGDARNEPRYGIEMLIAADSRSCVPAGRAGPLALYPGDKQKKHSCA